MAQFESKQAAWEYYLNLDSHHFEEKQHNNIYTDAFEAGAEWEHKRLIEMACEWLSNNKDNYIIDIEGETLVDDQIIKDFRKAMEE